MPNDDTLRTDAQAHEDALTSLIEANGLPHHKHVPLNSLDDLDRLQELATDDALLVFRVPHEVSVNGTIAGAGAASVISEHLPAHAQVMLSFDGYASDRRELFEVPEVVAFCRGMLFGPDLANPDLAHAKNVLPKLIDEYALSEDGTRHDAFDIAGRLWLVSMAFQAEVTIPNRRGVWTRKMDLAIDICEWLLGNGPPPRMR